MVFIELKVKGTLSNCSHYRRQELSESMKTLSTRSSEVLNLLTNFISPKIPILKALLRRQKLKIIDNIKYIENGVMESLNFIFEVILTVTSTNKSPQGRNVRTSKYSFNYIDDRASVAAESILEVFSPGNPTDNDPSGLGHEESFQK